AKKSGLFWCNGNVENLFQEVENLKKFWEDLPNTTINRDVPEGMFWVCGKQAYSKLPRDWRGTCTIGIIQPGFFLLPKPQNKILGKPL
ncbi:ENR1 protein, partial [Panurus biarmicus]|nr:ENR1 protein [Panurus biarmicus]